MLAVVFGYNENDVWVLLFCMDWIYIYLREKVHNKLYGVLAAEEL